MRLVMAGPADDAYAAQLRSLGQRLQITDILYWTGMVSGDVKWGALQSSEAFILPSHQENFGVAVAEALSAGLPVLISRQVNIWPTICDAGAGISDDDTIAGCARMLAAWLRLPADERAVMRSRARACFERNFTARAAAATLLSNIYLQLLGEERRRFDTWRLMAS
jgi:glycosyltransferase involved in cell wall biosynthesis